MQVLYFDCFSGISGDMALGALVNLGAKVSEIEDIVASIFHLRLSITESSRSVNHISASDIEIECDDHVHLHNFNLISDKISNSDLFNEDKQLIISIFNRIAKAEAKIHGTSIDEVHFHEIGAIDTIVDVVGTILALRQLGVSQCFSSPIPLSRGLKQMHHGIYPIPAPATLALLEHVSCYGVDSDIELVTPTGAAIITSLTDKFGKIPEMTIDAVGYGSGKSIRHDAPNVLRIIKGSISRTLDSGIGIIETNIDDMNPELFSYLFEEFFNLDGAVDLSILNILGKKNRPGFKIECLVKPNHIHDIANWIIANTTTLGVRTRIDNRITVVRETETITTKLGYVKIKSWLDPNHGKRYAPEYEECKRIAQANNIPIIDVYKSIIAELGLK
ncbi:MAG: nickel pincer cofactor biosynthesis protein LarC [Acidobacteriota bacterium]